VFLGLQGFSPTGWQAPRLINRDDLATGTGGRLALSACDQRSVQPNLPVQPLW